MLSRLIDQLNRGLLISCGVLAVSLTGSPVHAAEVIDRSDDCSAWTYDANGGFEGGQPTAMLVCSSESAFGDMPLQLSCSGERVSVHYFGALGERLPTDSSPVTLNYSFDSNAAFSEQAIYEAGPVDWASYPPLSTGLLEAFAKNFYVEVTTSETEDIERLPLVGSFSAIEQMKANCL